MIKRCKRCKKTKRIKAKELCVSCYTRVREKIRNNEKWEMLHD
jgi:RecB family endonuclease NucS